jgi:predicted GIY-YIG superfamily endonuclease
MKYSIEARDGYLYAALAGRETAEEMRQFLHAVHTACGEHRLPKILMAIRRSRPVFKAEDYGLDGNMRSYAHALVTPDCQIALLGDTEELHAAHEYIEMVARQQQINARAFRTESAALDWLRGAHAPTRRYRFTRIVIAGAPEDAGVYALWDGDEVIYYGHAQSIRARLMDHYQGKLDAQTKRATHYGWELCKDPVAREAELLREHERRFGKLPRLNSQAA